MATHGGEESEAHHLGAILDGLLGVEGAVLPGDALANDAAVLVHEHRRLVRRGDGGGGGVAPRPGREGEQGRRLLR